MTKLPLNNMFEKILQRNTIDTPVNRLLCAVVALAMTDMMKGQDDARKFIFQYRNPYLEALDINLTFIRDMMQQAREYTKK